MSSLGQYICLRLAARNDFVFLLIPFTEKVADESCVTLSTYDTGLSGSSQTGESWFGASVRKCGFLYARNVGVVQLACQSFDQVVIIVPPANSKERRPFKGTTKVRGASFLKMHSQVPGNYDYHDHDADDVKNVHCALQRRHAASI